MKIRFANSEDREQVMSLIAELMNTGSEILGKPLVNTTNLSSEAFDRLLERNDVKIFVAEENKKLVGLATLYIIEVMRRDKPRAELEELVVTKEVRGKGIGEKLLKQVLGYCKEHGVYALNLSTYLEMERAQKFYEKQGGKTVTRSFRFDIK